MRDGIISGLLSGLIVTAFVVLFRSLWHKIVVPWFEELVYKDATIEGKWFSFYPATQEMRQETITLKRHGHTVSGTIICAFGPDEGQSYSVRGSFRNMTLPLIYESDDRSRTDRGTFTLRLVRDGQRLRGYAAYYNTASDTIEPTQIIWFRSKKELESVVAKITANREKLVELVKKAAEAAQEMSNFINAKPVEADSPSPLSLPQPKDSDKPDTKGEYKDS